MMCTCTEFEYVLLSKICLECGERPSSRWCATCNASYCKSCNNTVHRSCAHMREFHKAVTHIFKRPPPAPAQLSTPASVSPKRSTHASQDSSLHSRLSVIAPKQSLLTGLGKSNECSIKGCVNPATQGHGIRFCYGEQYSSV
jgi:hypothetical protein